MTTPTSHEAQAARAAYAALIEQFGKGWSEGDAASIGSVFTEDGVFAPDPHAEPVTGRSAIEEYWRGVPYEQSEVAFRFGEILLSGPWFATEIKCTFRRRRTGERVDVRGALVCETVGGKISEMRMYWHRTVWKARE